MPQFDRDELVRAAKDAAHVAVGFSVLAAEHLASAFETSVRKVDDRVAAFEDRLGAILDDVQERLPEQASAVVTKARTLATETRQQVRSFVLRDAA